MCHGLNCYCENMEFSIREGLRIDQQILNFGLLKDICLEIDLDFTH